MAKFTQDAATSPRGIRSNSSTQECSLGTKVITPDGRAFRYVKAGATALVAGTLVDGPASVANHTNIACAVAATGATTVSVTLGATAVTVDQYAGGVLIINDVDGQGFTYSIKSHPAADASAAVVITLDSDEPIVTALTANSQATLIANQYGGVVVHAATEAGVPTGVANTQITALYFGWVQTRGPVSLLINATTAIGNAVSASDTTGDGGGEIGDGILCPIGYALTAGVATEYNAVFLNLE